jgi:hypothetical protein
MALLADAGVHEAGRGTPILNGITALVKTAEAVVRLNRIMGGRFTSKRLHYAPPTADQIDEIRKYYGDVYPSVKGGASTRVKGGASTRVEGGASTRTLKKHNSRDNIRK